MISREVLAHCLALGPVSVTFTKLDGTERVMNCTQALHLVPEDKLPTPKTATLLTEVPVVADQMRVFDLEVGDWRSFRFSTVKAVNLNV